MSSHMPRFAGSRRGVAALFLVLAAACETAPKVPTTFQKVQGDGQSATVNTQVTLPPSVRILDQDGQPLQGATVTFQVTEGAGSVSAPSALTDASGVASAVTWKLGTQTGANEVTATVQGLAPLTFTATATPGAPSSVQIVTGAAQEGRVGEPLPVSPAVQVQDAFGNAIPGAEVRFRVTAGNGQVEGATRTSDSEGVAAVGAWRLGPQVGENRLEAAVTGAAAATLTAMATAGPPSAVVPHAGNQQTARVAAAVPVPPAARVTDVYGNPVAGVLVTFSTSDAGAVVEPGAATTDASGVATVQRWVLGTRSGTQSLVAEAQGIAVLTMTATATAAAASAIDVVAGQGQTAAAGANVAVRPSVRLEDAYGNPVANTAVTFTVLSGGGTVTGPIQLTGADGVATVGAWTLGPAAGANALQATANGVSAVRFDATATAPDPGGGGNGGGDTGGGNGAFDIEVRVVAGLTASQQAIFEQAAARWEAVITGDLPAAATTVDANTCGDQHPAMSETVDDLVIFARAEAIDGPSGVLGRAGPCYIRNTGRLPIVGFMEFDAADLAQMEADGELLEVILHEMGHVLGIGTLWEDQGLLIGKGTSIPYFTGAGARQGFDDVGGFSFSGQKVPVEGSGGSGTRDSHWRESILDNELMTGFYDSGRENPMSLITIRSLEDLGYDVDVARAQTYSLNPALRAPGDESRKIQLIELPTPEPIVVGRDGVPIGRTRPDRR